MDLYAVVKSLVESHAANEGCSEHRAVDEIMAALLAVAEEKGIDLDAPEPEDTP
jgi:hypothetical protein